MALNPTMLAATSASHLRTFFAVQINVITTGTNINLIDGSGFVVFPVDGISTTFTGSDSVFGTLAGITSVEEKIASEAPSVSVTLMPASANAFGEINHPKNQGSVVRIWWGFVDDFSGAVIGSPELLWSGRLDIVQSNINENTQVCELITVSGFDRLFAVNEAECLNAVWHKSIWPGETGFDFNVASTADTPWGVEAPRPSTTPASTFTPQELFKQGKSPFG